MITYLSEDKHQEYKEFVNSRFANKYGGIEKKMSPLSEKKTIFAKLLVKHLYENIVHNEDFQIEEREKASFKFANFIVNSERIMESINSAAMVAIPESISDEQLFDFSDNISDNLTKIWVESAKVQMYEIEEAISKAKENNRQLSENQLRSRFPLFKEFHYLDNLEENNLTADVSTAMISKLSPEEKMSLAIKQYAFKSCLENLGIDINSKVVAERIDEEFKNSIYL